jgi:hypothetical protein
MRRDRPENCNKSRQVLSVSNAVYDKSLGLLSEARGGVGAELTRKIAM